MVGGRVEGTASVLKAQDTAHSAPTPTSLELRAQNLQLPPGGLDCLVSCPLLPGEEESLEAGDINQGSRASLSSVSLSLALSLGHFLVRCT